MIRLVAELKHRFTPVRIQTSLFHERKQGQNESVDSYAQNLKSLFHKAYPQVQQGGELAASIGKCFGFTICGRVGACP